MRAFTALIVSLALAVWSGPVAAENAAPDDVATVDGIIEALYASISGPAGPRDWDRFRSLMHPEARLLVHRADGLLAWTPDQYVENASRYFDENPFYEVELSRKMETYGGVTHVFSTYDSRNTPDGDPFTQGINSIQIIEAEGRLWILTILWPSNPDNPPIPERYLD